MSKPDLLPALNAALEDDDAHTACVAACRAVATALTHAGAVTWVGSWVFRDQAGEGLAILTEMAAELAAGAVQLFDRELWYAGSALVRQLIEVEYLVARFAENPTVGASWAASSPDELRQSFTPTTMRKASGERFRLQEYRTHCERGGHPSPQGRLLLKNHRIPFSSRRWHWVDLAQHLAPIWTDLCRCLEQRGDLQRIFEGFVDQVNGALQDWQQRDPLAARLDPALFAEPSLSTFPARAEGGRKR